jgi:hypothetical protein
MNAGTSVIIQGRLAKRLKQIQEFLKDCKNKADVSKKVEESHQKALDQHNGFSFGVLLS